MTEGELESALCRAFSVMLPDLYAEGYRIESQQAILLGRRIDLFLRKPNGSSCIIELKAGSPPMPHVRDQIPVINPETSGDFEIMFQVFGTVKSHSLVVSTFIPNETKKLLEFKVKLAKVALVLNGELVRGRGVMRSIHESIRKMFREGVYTDRREVICEFTPPSTVPWWVTIDDITRAP